MNFNFLITCICKREVAISDDLQLSRLVNCVFYQSRDCRKRSTFEGGCSNPLLFERPFSKSFPKPPDNMN